MQIVRYRTGDSVRVGVVDGDEVVETSAESVCDDLAPTGTRHRLAAVQLVSPIERSASVVCVGLNYRDHAAEAGAQIPTSPVLFAKLTNTLTGHDADIAIPTAVTQQVDYEAELGVVIGRRTSGVSADAALDHVLGYTCVNDLSARDLQFADGQWVRGKSVDGFGPVGPAIVTTEEVGDPQRLRVRCRVNGLLVQDASTAEMIFPVAELVAFVSRTIELNPGDLLCTGTPAGVGVARDPQLFLVPGDVVEVEIERVGLLRNRMTERAG